MKITILGSGNASINEDRHESSYLLEHNGRYYLFDSGAGTLYQLLKKGFDTTEIDNIFYTHFHNDHINDLPAIIWSNNYHHNPKTNTLNIYGPKRIRDYVNMLIKNILAFNTKQENSDDAIKKFRYSINVNEITNKEFELDGLKIKTQELKHFKNIAYRIEHNNKVFVYTGDTGYCDELIEICKNADICIMECGVLIDENNLHMTPELCAKAAKHSKIKKLVLTHRYPELDNVDVIKIVKKEFDGEVVLAEDFLEFTL